MIYPKCEWRGEPRYNHCTFQCPPRWSSTPCVIWQLQDFYYEGVDARRAELSKKIQRLAGVTVLD